VPLRVAAIQHDIAWEDPGATTAALSPWVARAAETGAGLVVLAEMFATGFSMHVQAQDENGEIVAWMHEQTRAHGIRLAGSVALAGIEGDRPTNRLLVVGPDGIEQRYDKIHPFSYAGEHERFAPGREPAVAVVDGIRLGLSVCYDLRFANLYWALAADVDAYLVVANWPRARRTHWSTLVRARAIENQAYVVAVNRVGTGGEISYAGDSAIIDPIGEVLVSAAGEPTMLLADLDPEVVASTRSRYPFLADRR
jgi:predicted amidohydrolase